MSTPENADTDAVTVTLTVTEVRFLDWYLKYADKRDEAECKALRRKLKAALEERINIDGPDA